MPLTDSGGNLPRYGDGDDGMAVQLQALGARRDAWLYRVCRAKLGAHVPGPSEGSLPSALLGAAVQVDTKWSPPRVSTAFQDAGIYVLASQRNTPQEVFVLADAGPHGFSSTAAHAHADALSFTLSVGGRPILIDPGTYDYLRDERWRQYFRSTLAHNTVAIDGLDQSTPVGLFLWTQKARTTVHSWTVAASSARLVASHDGYRRVGVTHQRCLELQGHTLTILDELRGLGAHRATLCFHLAPECTVERLSTSVLMIAHDNVKVRLTLPSSLVVEQVRGSAEAGWYSPRYGAKQPTWSILAQASGSLPLSLKTILEVLV